MNRGDERCGSKSIEKKVMIELGLDKCAAELNDADTTTRSGQLGARWPRKRIKRGNLVGQDPCRSSGFY